MSTLSKFVFSSLARPSASVLSRHPPRPRLRTLSIHAASKEDNHPVQYDADDVAKLQSSAAKRYSFDSDFVSHLWESRKRVEDSSSAIDSEIVVGATNRNNDVELGLKPSTERDSDTVDRGSFDAAFVGALWRLPKGATVDDTTPVSLDLDDGVDAFGSLATDAFKENVLLLQRTYDVDNFVDDSSESATVDSSSSTHLAISDSRKEIDKPSLLYPDSRSIDVASKSLTKDFRLRGFKGQPRDSEWFNLRIKKLVLGGCVREALQLFHFDMKEAGVEPTYATFRFLIGGCGRIGDVDAASALLQQMRHRQIPVYGQIYAAVLNAAANCPDTGKAMETANELWAELIASDFDVGPDPPESGSWPVRLYKSYMMVHLSHGDPSHVFQLFQEMISVKRLKPDDSIFWALLLAASKDAEDGFYKALLIWRWMTGHFGIPPETFHYDQLLRCVRRCGVKDVAALFDLERGDDRLGLEGVVRERIENEDTKFTFDVRNRERNFKRRGQKNKDGKELLTTTTTTTPTATTTTAELATPPPSFSCDLVVRPSNIKKVMLKPPKNTWDRLALLGGAEKIVERMLETGESRPSETSFALLLRCQPNDFPTLQNQLHLMDTSQVRPDTAWFHVALEKVTHSGNFPAVWRFLNAMKERGVPRAPATFRKAVNVVKNQDDLRRFVEEIKDANVEPEVATFTHLTRRFRRDLDTQAEIFRVVTEEFRLEPSEEMLKEVEGSLKRVGAGQRNGRRGRDVGSIGFYRLKERFDDWMSTNGRTRRKVIDVSED